jgi:hypothetical protein
MLALVELLEISFLTFKLGRKLDDLAAILVSRRIEHIHIPSLGCENANVKEDPRASIAISGDGTASLVLSG